MKLLSQLFDSLRTHFSEGGKLAKLHPLFEAIETVFFIPGHPTQTLPHMRDSLDLKRFMSYVLVALAPPLAWGIYNTGYQALAATGQTVTLFGAVNKGLIVVMPLIIVSYVVGLFWEVLFASIRKHPISEGFLVTGLLYPLTLPPTMPLWQAAIGITFGVVIGKEIFGGTGRNILNPALTARAFVFFAYPAQMSGDAVWIAAPAKAIVDTVSGATPLAVSALTPPGTNIATALGDSGFSFSTLFFGAYPASIGETSVLCSLIGAVILVAVGVANYRTIIGGIAGLLLTAGLLNLFAGDGSPAWFGLNPLYHLVMGGFAFGITYMATDPVSGPGVQSARWIYGFLIGMLTILIRVFNPAFPEGAMLAILFMNLFAPLLDHVAIRRRMKKRVPNV